MVCGCALDERTCVSTDVTLPAAVDAGRWSSDTGACVLRIVADDVGGSGDGSASAFTSVSAGA